MNIETNSPYLMKGALAADKSKQSVLEERLRSKPATDEELMEVCKSFESYFLEQVMKGMEKTIPYDDKKNPYVDYFGDVLWQEYAKSATENQGLGLAQMLYESLKRNGLDT
jgi:flagellar protein FlgJ